MNRKKAPSITLSQLRMLLKLLLPMKKHSLQTMLEEIVAVQTRNHRARQCHRKKRLKELGRDNQLAL